MREEEIIKFINKFQTAGMTDNFINGFCYWFAVILRNRFPEMRIFYDLIDGHFFCYDPETKYCYDAIGKFKQTYPLSRYADWEEYSSIDPIHYNRISELCIKMKG